MVCVLDGSALSPISTVDMDKMQDRDVKISRTSPSSPTHLELGVSAEGADSLEPHGQASTVTENAMEVQAAAAVAVAVVEATSDMQSAPSKRKRGRPKAAPNKPKILGPIIDGVLPTSRVTRRSLHGPITPADASDDGMMHEEETEFGPVNGGPITDIPPTEPSSPVVLHKPRTPASKKRKTTHPGDLVNTELMMDEPSKTLEMDDQAYEVQLTRSDNHTETMVGEAMDAPSDIPVKMETEGFANPVIENREEFDASVSEAPSEMMAMDIEQMIGSSSDPLQGFCLEESNGPWFMQNLKMEGSETLGPQDLKQAAMFKGDGKTLKSNKRQCDACRKVKGRILSCSSCPLVFHYTCVEEGFDVDEEVDGMWSVKVACISGDPHFGARSPHNRLWPIQLDRGLQQYLLVSQHYSTLLMPVIQRLLSSLDRFLTSTERKRRETRTVTILDWVLGYRLPRDVNRW
ncbi:hypothetical protein BC829DRAFT_283451 [Chytridium lagenaria]|nr:hypothetical protein BC829DRAFT_283451 [Chytridium lagenaria]